MISIPVGSAGENAAGELVVRPKSVVHLDCVFYRRLGSPSWIKATEGNISLNKSHPKGIIFSEIMHAWESWLQLMAR